MAQKTVAALSLALFTQTAEYVKGLKTADTSTKAFAKGAKDAGKAVGDAFQNIASGIPQVNPLLVNLVGVVQGGVKAFKAMGLAAKGASAAFISTGIGAIVVALGTAFAALSAWVSRTTEGADKAKTVWAGVTAVFEEILDRVSILGSAIGKFVSGDFFGAAQEIKRFWESVKAFGDDVNDSLAKGVDLQNRENQLRKDKIAFITREAEILAEIAELRRKAQDSEAGFSQEQQLGFIQKAIELQKKLGDERRRLAQEEANIQSERIRLSDSNYNDLEKEAQLKRAVLDITVAENNGLRELLEKQKSLTGLVEKEAAAREKSAAAISMQVQFEPPSMSDAEDVIGKTLKPVSLDVMPRIEDPEEASALADTETELQRIRSEAELTGNAISTSFGAGFADASGQVENFGKTVGRTSKKILQGYLAESVGAAIKNALATVPFPFNLIAAAGAGAAASTLFNRLIPAFAAGGIMPYSGTALVGEQGPELVSLPKGSRVYNNSDTQRMLGGAQRIEVVGEALLRGSDIYISFKEESRKRGNISG